MVRLYITVGVMKREKNRIKSKDLRRTYATAMKGTEYLRTLGIALQIEEGVALTQGDEQRTSDTLFPTLDRSEHQSSADDIMHSLHAAVSRRFEISECTIFFCNPNRELQPSTSEATSTSLFVKAKRLEEDGIVDWLLDSYKPAIVPNFHQSSFDCEHYFILIPLVLRGSLSALFLGETIRDPDSFSDEDLSLITAFAESAARTLDTIRSSEEMATMNMRINLLNEQMMKSSKMATLGELASNVVHEVNNPLQIMLAHLQLLENGVGDTGRRIEIIKEQCLRIAGISRRLLDFARNSPVDNSAEPVNLYHLVDDVIAFTETQLQREGITILKQFDAEPVLVSGVRTQIEQILLNLIINAKDAMSGGGTLTIGVFSEKEQALLTISDTGSGISAQDIPYIFDPFFSTKARGKGSGLGLSISKGIIEQHGGEIHVVSDVGKGTTFKIVLPLCELSGIRSIRRSPKQPYYTAA